MIRSCFYSVKCIESEIATQVTNTKSKKFRIKDYVDLPKLKLDFFILFYLCGPLNVLPLKNTRLHLLQEHRK